MSLISLLPKSIHKLVMVRNPKRIFSWNKTVKTDSKIHKKSKHLRTAQKFLKNKKEEPALPVIKINAILVKTM